MAKARISNADLIWIIHEKLREFEDDPKLGIAIAVVAESKSKWRSLVPQSVHARRPLWAERVDAIEKKLQKRYILAG